MAKIIDFTTYRIKNNPAFGMSDIQELADYNLKYRCPDLIYEIVFSNSMYNRLGFCSCKTKGKYKYATLKFSVPFFKACLDTGNIDTMRDTVLHEIGHAIVYYAYGAGHGHDSIWKDIMLMLGGRPERVSDNNFFRPYRYIYRCPYCGNETKTLKKYRQGISCGKCCDKYNSGKYSPNYILDLVCDEGRIVDGVC